MQEVHLDKHVKLLDSPGIVMDSGNSDSAVILRNCVKVHHENILTVLLAFLTLLVSTHHVALMMMMITSILIGHHIFGC